jgi:hypothetical protein
MGGGKSIIRRSPFGSFQEFVRVKDGRHELAGFLTVGRLVSCGGAVERCSEGSVGRRGGILSEGHVGNRDLLNRCNVRNLGSNRDLRVLSKRNVLWGHGRNGNLLSKRKVLLGHVRNGDLLSKRIVLYDGHGGNGDLRNDQNVRCDSFVGHGGNGDVRNDRIVRCESFQGHGGNRDLLSKRNVLSHSLHWHVDRQARSRDIDRDISRDVDRHTSSSDLPGYRGTSDLLEV